MLIVFATISAIRINLSYRYGMNTTMLYVAKFRSVSISHRYGTHGSISSNFICSVSISHIGMEHGDWVCCCDDGLVSISHIGMEL